MADDPQNTLASGSGGGSSRTGDVPINLRRRYLSDPHGGPGLGFFVDTTVTVAAFRDHGNRLTATRTEPQVIRDLVAIAQHRGWERISVSGAPDFRREIWLAGRAAGLEVQGHRPTSRDRQALTRRLEARSRRRPDDRAPGIRPDTRPSGHPPDPLKVVEAVVRGRIVEPADQGRILAAARQRLAAWLERGARFDGLARGERTVTGRHRSL